MDQKLIGAPNQRRRKERMKLMMSKVSAVVLKYLFDRRFNSFDIMFLIYFTFLLSTERISFVLFIIAVIAVAGLSAFGENLSKDIREKG